MLIQVLPQLLAQAHICSRQRVTWQVAVWTDMGCLQVEGQDLAPFIVEKENLLMFAMFNPLNEKLWIHQAHIDNVRTPTHPIAL